MSNGRVFSAAGELAVELLRGIAASADVFPPLASAAGCALNVAEAARSFGLNRAEWREFGIYVRNATATVVRSLTRVSTSQDDTRLKLVELQSILDDIIRTIQSEQALRWHKRFRRFLKHPEMIAGMRAKIDDTMSLFQLETTVTTMMDVVKILEAVIANNNILSGIARNTLRSGSMHAALERLRRVPGASWDMYRVCLSNTRVDLISKILIWIEDPNGLGESNENMSTQGAKILLLTAVAGAGKTTIAHTIAQRCAEKDQLVSSFFFDRETEGRNNASALFSSIAADISQLDNYLAERITAAIEADRALPTAPLSRQFEELVLKPCQGYNASKPVVFVIDGLDEAWNDHLLNILRDHSFHLPSAFRIFLTSRMRPELDSLCRQPHVRRVNFDIGTQTNMDDIALFIPHKLQQLARDRDLGENWPTNQVLSSFISKADGLFLWVVTVCEYLRGRDDPTEELNELLTTDDLQATSAEEQMDRLYATILESFDWTDARFVAGYHRVMGMAIATHTPLTISAMKALYREEPLASDYALQRMSPLLTGMNREDHGSEAVRVLHQSLRDFLVARASHSPHYTNFQIAEKKQSQQLALLCLKIMNRELSENIVGTGFLSINEYETRGVPSMSDGHISEALWYACQFWLDHILDVESPLLIEEALQVFMAWKAVLWMEVLAARGRCRRLTEVQTWMQRHGLSYPAISQGQKSDEEYADTCMSLSARLIYDDRQEEALDITEEAVGLYRKFSDNNNTRYSPVLASSLKELSDRLSELGRYHEALLVMQESVELHQKLVITNGLDEFMPELAAALSGLSVRLASLGRHSEALTEIEKAVELARQLAVDGSNEGISQLAKYLNNLSVYLSALGRYEEALLQTEQVVEIRRRLAADDPNSFAYSLAKSLNSLSIRLSDLNRHNEALPVIQEAVRLYRKLAIMRPAAMTLDLAISLNNLSRRLTNLGRHEEALPVMQEAVELHRRLATNRPAACIPNLAMSLNNLALCILALERPEEALPVMQEAAELHQQLATTSPSAYTADLKRSLNGLADIFTRLSRDVEANDAREKASKLC